MKKTRERVLPGRGRNADGLMPYAAPSQQASRLAAFREGLNRTGYVEMPNVAIEYRSADGQYEPWRPSGGRRGHRS
jgi:hypothetical protein